MPLYSFRWFVVDLSLLEPGTSVRLSTDNSTTYKSFLQIYAHIYSYYISYTLKDERNFQKNMFS